MTKADSRCAECSHSLSMHRRPCWVADETTTIPRCAFNWTWDEVNGWYDGAGDACPCHGHVQRVKDPERVKRGKRNKRRGYSAEALVARLVGGKRDRASIVDVAVRGEDGRAFAVFECKKRDAKVLHGFMRQAQVGAALMPERPPAYVAIIPHGSEKLDEILVLSTLGEWIDSHGRGVE